MRTLLMSLVLFGVLSAGCQKSETDPAPAVSKSEGAAGGSPVAFRNAEGKLLCPVMNATIESEDKADGYQDFEGTRYYFCCAMCPDKFKENPKMYTKK